MALTDDVPVYVTRETAQGIIGAVFVPAWLPLAALGVVFSNVLGWGLYSLYILADKIV